MPELKTDLSESLDFVTAVVCTCNRGDSVLMAIESILTCQDAHFELLIIDQSSNDDTARAVEPYLSDPRVRLVRSNTKGLGHSHNIALEHAHSDIIAITDDDCEVPSDWLEKIRAIFARLPTVAAVFYNVDAAPHDSKLGFIPAFQCQGVRLLTQTQETPGGIGAGMAVRRSMILAIGGFDDKLGPGALFPSGDEQDLCARLLMRGYHVLSTNETHVMHYGFRTWQQGRALVQRDCGASGAFYGKLYRSGDKDIRAVFRRNLIGLVKLPFADLRKGKRPQGLLRITSFIKGFWQGLRVPMDPQTLRFCDRDNTADR